MPDVINMSAVSNADFMRSIVDMEPTIFQFEMDMKRKRIVGFDDQGNPKYVFGGKPRISDEGLQDIISEIRAFANPSTPFSYTQEQGFNNIMKITCTAFARRLGVKMRAWGVEPSDYLVICDKVRLMKELMLRKSIKRNFQEFSQNSRQTVENSYTENTNKGGILGIFGGGNKKPPQ